MSSSPNDLSNAPCEKYTLHDLKYVLSNPSTCNMLFAHRILIGNSSTKLRIPTEKKYLFIQISKTCDIDERKKDSQKCFCSGKKIHSHENAEEKKKETIRTLLRDTYRMPFCRYTQGSNIQSLISHTSPNWKIIFFLLFFLVLSIVLYKYIQFVYIPVYNEKKKLFPLCGVRCIRKYIIRHGIHDIGTLYPPQNFLAD